MKQLARAVESVPVAAPLVGYRAWTISRPAFSERLDHRFYRCSPFEPGPLSRARLRGLAVGVVWRRTSWRSKCQTYLDVPPQQLQMLELAGLAPHEAPERDCGCGWWAYDSPRRFGRVVELLPVGGPYAYGEVELWGRIVPFKHGYRAEYARPRRIIAVNASELEMEELRDYYGCEVEPGPPLAERFGSWLLVLLVLLLLFNFLNAFVVSDGWLRIPVLCTCALLGALVGRNLMRWLRARSLQKRRLAIFEARRE